MQIETSIVLVTLIITCAMGWYTRYVSCMALLYYIGKKGYEFPNDEEIKECTACVTAHLLRRCKKCMRIRRQ